MGWVMKLIKGGLIALPSYVAFTDIFYAVRTVDGQSMQVRSFCVKSQIYSGLFNFIVINL